MSFIFTAQEKGYFSDENIDFQFVTGNGTADVARHVIAGDAQFGWSSADAVLFAAEQGAKLKTIQAFWANIYELVYLPSKCKCQIQSLADLKGKTVGVQSDASITRFVLLEALAAQSLSEGDFGKEISVGYNPGPPLSTGQIDTYTSWPNLTLGLKSQPGLESLATYHLDVSAFPDSLIVTEDTWDGDQPLVQAFFRALKRGIVYERDHPDEVSAFLGKYIPGNTQSPAALLSQIKNNDEALSAGGEASGEPLGWIDVAAIKAGQDVLLKTGLMKSKVDVDPLFTNDLVQLYADFPGGQ